MKQRQMHRDRGAAARLLQQEAEKATAHSSLVPRVGFDEVGQAKLGSVVVAVLEPGRIDVNVAYSHVDPQR